MYIYHHLFTICTTCRTKTFFKDKSMPLGSPHLRLLLTGMLQEVLL